MKKLFFILFTITAMFAFTACGSDDEKEEMSFNTVCKQSVQFKGIKNQSTTSEEISAALEDLLKASATGYDGTRISSGTLNITGNTSAAITGLKEGIVLNNLKVKINGVEKSFGNISVASNNLNLYNDQNIDFFKDAFTRMIKNHNLTVQVTFTPSEDILASDNVKLNIDFYYKISFLFIISVCIQTYFQNRNLVHLRNIMCFCGYLFLFQGNFHPQELYLL